MFTDQIHDGCATRVLPNESVPVSAPSATRVSVPTVCPASVAVRVPDTGSMLSAGAVPSNMDIVTTPPEALPVSRVPIAIMSMLASMMLPEIFNDPP